MLYPWAQHLLLPHLARRIFSLRRVPISLLLCPSFPAVLPPCSQSLIAENMRPLRLPAGAQGLLPGSLVGYVWVVRRSRTASCCQGTAVHPTGWPHDLRSQLHLPLVPPLAALSCLVLPCPAVYALAGLPLLVSSSGEDLCQQGDVADCFWILVEGTVEAVRYK